MKRCPLCGAHVLYAGAVRVECTGGGCPNSVPPPPPLPEPESSQPAHGTLAWARQQHAAGRRVGYLIPLAPPGARPVLDDPFLGAWDMPGLQGWKWALLPAP